jgi:hypothetical protein
MALVNTNLTQPANATAAFRGEDGDAIVQARSTSQLVAIQRLRSPT